MSLPGLALVAAGFVRFSFSLLRNLGSSASALQRIYPKMLRTLHGSQLLSRKERTRRSLDSLCHPSCCKSRHACNVSAIRLHLRQLSRKRRALLDAVVGKIELGPGVLPRRLAYRVQKVRRFDGCGGVREDPDGLGPTSERSSCCVLPSTSTKLLRVRYEGCLFTDERHSKV